MDLVLDVTVTLSDTLLSLELIYTQQPKEALWFWKDFTYKIIFLKSFEDRMLMSYFQNYESCRWYLLAKLWMLMEFKHQLICYLRKNCSLSSGLYFFFEYFSKGALFRKIKLKILLATQYWLRSVRYVQV